MKFNYHDETNFFHWLEIVSWRIWTIFEQCDWEWMFDGKSRIPSAKEIEEELKKRIYNLIDEGIECDECGRIMITLNKEEQSVSIHLELDTFFGDQISQPVIDILDDF